MTREGLEKLATHVVNAAFEVHRELGPGLLESTYEMAFCHELHVAGLRFERQKDMPVAYKGIKLDLGYRLDVLVENQILVELKAVEELLPIHEAQLLSYLKHADMPLGFLINFNVPLIRDGIRRRVHRLPSS